MVRPPLATSQLEDVNQLREAGSPSKERLTVQWLSQSIAEIRSELAELQSSFGGGSKDAQFRNQLLEDLSTLRNEFGTAKLELESLRSRQEKTEVLVRELQEEAVQSADDIRRSLNMRHEKLLHFTAWQEASQETGTGMNIIEVTDDHFQRVLPAYHRGPAVTPTIAGRAFARSLSFRME
uniref:Uncharacterized protein n=1 Tax=Anopheles maculatus TaxID=74869 RepID=A0A182SU05_9DIPT